MVEIASKRDIRHEVEEMLIECIGDDQFLEDDDYANLDLVGEYNLEIYDFVEIVKALQSRFGLDVQPTQVEWDDINTVDKVTHFVESRFS